MASLDDDISRDLRQAGLAHALAEGSMTEFLLRCRAYDWVNAEDARRRAVDHLDAYCDHMAASYKRLEGAGARAK